MLQQEMRQWYVVYSKPRKEEFAEFNLRQKGLEVFFPRLRLPGSRQKRKQIVPLFPNYLFVKIQVFSEEYHYVTWSPGVKRLGKHGDDLFAFPEGARQAKSGEKNFYPLLA